MANEDGGPAFPTGGGYDAAFNEYVADRPGLSLRDWFAGQAVDSAVQMLDIEQPNWEERLAKSAYRIADAMLAERKRNA